MSIPVIDIFAGPGGLGEGFARYKNDGKSIFKNVLSVEMEDYAYQTLKLRSFYRQFPENKLPEAYYEVMRGKKTVDELYREFPEIEKAALEDALHAKLGTDDESINHKDLDNKIRSKVGNKVLPDGIWVLTGGPPCQAYSLAGRSRRQELVLDANTDVRVDLYKEYLRILAVHNPAVFIMENVKGLLSANSKDSPIFRNILNDLQDPKKTVYHLSNKEKAGLECPGYQIYSLTIPPREFTLDGTPINKAKDFIIESEKYGVPQTRHRVILLGIRKDLTPENLFFLEQEKEPTPISDVLNLPPLRSALSKIDDSLKNWKAVINMILDEPEITRFDHSIDLYCSNVLRRKERDKYLRRWYKRADISKIYKVFSELEELGLNDVSKEMKEAINKISKAKLTRGAEFVAISEEQNNERPIIESWLLDKKIGGFSNHESRGHMITDLFRYLFVSSFGKVRDYSPKLKDFPISLLPAHKNVKKSGHNKFADRFRVQLANEPAKTITSHISKDGHYFIHPDPAQCRSLTVREAARIQTFPDNYYFCGPRTAQYVQVGNAVPPLLANKIAGITYKYLLNAIK